MTVNQPYRPPPPAPLVVIHEDADILVVDKPSGLLTVPGRGAEKRDCLYSRVCECYPGALVVHRLDMETSGLVIFALGQKAQGRLGRLFQVRHVHKVYLARVWGIPDPAEGEVDLPLICDWPRRPRQIVDQQDGKPAQTRYRVVAREARDIARLELYPRTGRSHQLRVHMQAIGHPILGDGLYAHEPARQGVERLQLHAAKLAFVHPATGDRLALHSPAPF